MSDYSGSVKEMCHFCLSRKIQSRHSDSLPFFSSLFNLLAASLPFPSFSPVQFCLFCEFIIPDRLTSMSRFFFLSPHPPRRLTSFFSNSCEHHFHWNVPGWSRGLILIIYCILTIRYFWLLKLGKLEVCFPHLAFPKLNYSSGGKNMLSICCMCNKQCK